MSQTNFDFNDFSSKKFNVYLKEYCKPVMVRKAQAGIVLVDYKMAGKKIPCVFIPIKKKPDAMKIFKQIKGEKVHMLKKTGLVEVQVGKSDDGKEEINLNIRKGGLSVDILKTKGSKLFESGVKMKLNVLGGAETEKPGTENADNTAQEEGEALGTENAAANDSAKIKAVAQSTQQAFTEFKELLPALKSNSLNAEQSEKLNRISEQFEKFNQMVSTVSAAQKGQLDKLVQAVNKAAAAIAKLSPQGSAASSNQNADNPKDLKQFSTDVKALVAEFKELKKTIDKNLADLESDENDVKMVEDMIGKVTMIEDRYDAFSQESQDKLSKVREAIKAKIAPALQTMLKDVVKYLKIRDKVVGSKAKNNDEAKSRIADLNERLAALESSLAAN